MAEQGSAPGEFVARCVWVVVGVLVIGLGSGLLKAIDVGVDPYTAANIGISTLLGWDLGGYQLLSNLVLFIPMLIWGRKYIGVGSVANMAFTGYAIQFFAGTAPITPLAPMIVDAPVLKMIPSRAHRAGRLRCRLRRRRQNRSRRRTASCRRRVAHRMPRWHPPGEN
ncbi:MAG: hypothetical protein R2692_04785 [Microbacterium sp.]